MNDDRIQRYLADRAEGITLEPADASAVIKRGTRRRNQKRGGVLAAVAVMGVLGTSLVLQDPGDDQSVDSEYASSIAPSNLDWTVVQPDVGLGYGSSTVALSDGSVYALSTAPGPMTGQSSYNQHLYRSADGAEWAEVTLPAGLKTSSLSAGGDTLYAVGTAPAGGNARTISVAASSDGGESWSTVTLPEDVAALERSYPGKISIGTPSVAALDATHQVASLTVSANIDPTQYRSDIPENAGWETTDTGVKIFEPMEDCSTELPAIPADPTSEEMEKFEEEATAIRMAGSCAPKEGSPEVIASYTWDELGVPAELQEYIGGETFAYVTDDGATFERVDVPSESSGWTSSKVIRATDGYLLFIASSDQDSATTAVLSSADGHSWTEGIVLAGGLNNAGLLGDRAAVSVWIVDGTSDVQVQQADGTWTSLELSSAIEPPAGYDAYVGEVAFGPLGVAATVTSSPRDGNGPAHGYLVHSTDGVTLSVLDLADYLDDGTGYPSGLTVTADAITVRSVRDPDGDASTVEPTDVLVGTPR